MKRTGFNQGNVINNLLDEFLAPIVSEQPSGKQVGGTGYQVRRKAQFWPAVNILEGETGYQIEIATPGFHKENFEIKIEKDQLNIAGAKEVPAKGDQDQEADELKYTRREFNFAKFHRSFHLPEDLNKDEIKASYENGILIIAIPKAEKIIEKTKLISVS